MYYERQGKGGSYVKGDQRVYNNQTQCVISGAWLKTKPATYRGYSWDTLENIKDKFVECDNELCYAWEYPYPQAEVLIGMKDYDGATYSQLSKKSIQVDEQINQNVVKC